MAPAATLGSWPAPLLQIWPNHERAMVQHFAVASTVSLTHTY